MLIGGLQRFTLSDYPGMTAAVLFCQGCNFRCPFCHNQGLLPAAPAADALPPAEALEYLAQRKGVLGGVVLSGGEPTLQADLTEFIQEIKKHGYKVKLDTNGSRPVVIDRLLSRQLVDYIAMDIKAPWYKYPALAGVKVATEDIAESIRCIATSGSEHHFRTTLVEPLLDSTDITAIRGMVPDGSRHILQPFTAAHALDPALHKTNRTYQQRDSGPPARPPMDEW